MKRYSVLLAAFVGIDVSAQSYVNVSGLLDAAATRTETKVANQTVHRYGLYPSGMSSTYFRFDGREDLGGGAYAGFRLEAGLNIDAGTGIASNTNNQRSGVAASATDFNWNRWSYVSLGSASLGELRVGRVYTAAFESFTPFDPFFTNGVGSMSTIALRLGLKDTQTALNVSNALDYLSPHYGRGFFARGTVATGENPSNGMLATNNPRHGGDHVAGRLGYAEGPLAIGFSSGLTRNTAGVSNGGNNPGDYLNTDLAVRYDTAWLRLYGQYVTERIKGATANAGTLTGNPSQKARTRSLMLGGVIPVGNGNIKLAVTDGKLTDNVGGAAEKGRLYAVGYDYYFSKRTNVYAVWSRINNNAVGSYGLTAAYQQPGRGQSTSALAGGLRVQF